MKHDQRCELVNPFVTEEGRAIYPPACKCADRAFALDPYIAEDDPDLLLL